jgi:hypothetical protein
MHAAIVKELKSTDAELTVELGFIPSYAIIKNVTSGASVEYINTRLGLSQMAIDDGAVTNDITDGEYIAADGTLASDSGLTRTPEGSIGQVAATAAGIVIAADLADINDAVGEQLIVIAFRSDL